MRIVLVLVVLVSTAAQAQTMAANPFLNIDPNTNTIIFWSQPRSWMDLAMIFNRSGSAAEGRRQDFDRVTASATTGSTSSVRVSVTYGGYTVTASSSYDPTDPNGNGYVLLANEIASGYLRDRFLIQADAYGSLISFVVVPSGIRDPGQSIWYGANTKDWYLLLADGASILNACQGNAYDSIMVGYDTVTVKLAGSTITTLSGDPALLKSLAAELDSVARYGDCRQLTARSGRVTGYVPSGI
jgi:hypothetical protein